MLVAAGERLNALAGQHWRLIATQASNGFWAGCLRGLQDYFDKHGVFFCTVVAAPILLLAAGMVRVHSPGQSGSSAGAQAVHTVWSCGSLLIKVKAEQFKREIRSKEKRKKAVESNKDKQS